MKTGQATEAQVRAIEFPQKVYDTLKEQRERRGNTTWEPLLHRDVLDKVEASLARHNLELYRDDDGNIQKTFTVAAKGAKMFVALPLNSLIMADMRFMIVIVNSFDKSIALRIGYGSECGYCTNGLVIAQRVVGMKHCPGTVGEGGSKLDGELDAAIEQFGFWNQVQHDFYDKLKRTTLSNTQFNDLLVKGWRKPYEAITPGEADAVLDQWETPRFDEFRPRNAFSAINAFTDVLRRGGGNRPHGVALRNGPTFVDRSTALTRLFQNHFANEIEFDPSLN